MTPALVVLAVLAGAVTAVLFVPVRIEFDADIGPEVARPVFRVRVRWAGLSWRSDAPVRPKPAPPPPVIPTPRRRGGGGAALRAALRSPGFVRRCVRLIVESGRTLAPRAGVVRLRIGLDDPASTGVFVGTLAGALAAWAGMRAERPLDFRLTPDFLEPIVAGQAHVAWRLRPAVVLWPAIKFVGTPVVWRAARSALRAARAAGA